ncbi:MAG: hypothetical protein J6B03_02850 [Candidatus Homeothermus sp.]|nr:hypothetical protein [Candidatus Homeothermus sp.]
MNKWQKIVFMAGLLLIEAIIMLYIVPKTNEDEINMQVRVVVDLALAMLISLALLIRENRGERKSVVRLFLICVATYIQIGYTSAFYEWSGVCLTLPIFQIVFGYAIFKLSHNITSLLVCCSNLLFSTIWANQTWGFLWFKNISNDLETVAIASLYAISGALIVLAISSIMIMKFSPKLLTSDETER